MRGAATVVAGLALWLCAVPGNVDASDRVVLASKKFTESVVLGEVLTGLARDAGVEALHRRELGGTRVVWNALIAGDVDAYVEYTGTLEAEILAGRASGADEVARELAEAGIRQTRSLGFNNTYVLGMRRDRAQELGVSKISELADRKGLRFGLTSEFMDRADGWPGLRDRYGLDPRDVRGLDHDVAYRSLAAGSIDVLDLYATDAEIELYDLARLEDDREYFPRYEAVILYRADLEQRAPKVLASFERLVGKIREDEMVSMNRRAKIERVPEARVAADFLRDALGLSISVREETLAARLGRHTLEHLFLVGISLVMAIAVAIPLGIAAARSERYGGLILGTVGVIQTVPSLALLVVMIPLLGIGAPPAIAAMFLYSLLPIVRNTHTGIATIPSGMLDSAEVLGLSPGARLRSIELPLASRSILAGIKTSAVINVGTATLGALIGAGGYGQLILTGIRLADNGLILMGALPAAFLALAVQGVFEGVERAIVPRGLRRSSG